MIFNKKKIRYYYWVLIEFFKKNIFLFFASFLVSFILIFVFLSLSPYLKVIFNKEKVIGLVGEYSLNNPPDEIANNLSNGLVMISEKGEIVPVLASYWEIKDNGKRYRFYLKDNLIWSNGKKLKAEDIDFQFKDIKYQVVDDRTIDFFLEKPLGIFPLYLNKPILKYPLIGIGGLYKVGKVKVDQGFLKEIFLIPNIKDLQPLRYKFYLNESALILAYKKGEINEMTVSKKSVADSFSNWRNSIIEKKVDYSRLLTIFFNFKNPLFENKNFRTALRLLIDEKKYEDNGEKAKSSIPPNSWAYNKNLKDYFYDKETAKKIIEKELSSTSSSQLNFLTFYDNYEVADLYVNELKEVGLSVNLNIISHLQNNDFDMLLAYLKIPSDPDQYFYWHSTQTEGNIGSYKNVKVDLLLEEGRSVIHLEKRISKYLDLQKIMQDDPPALFLYYPYIYTIKRK